MSRPNPFRSPTKAAAPKPAAPKSPFNKAQHDVLVRTMGDLLFPVMERLDRLELTLGVEQAEAKKDLQDALDGFLGTKGLVPTRDDMERKNARDAEVAARIDSKMKHADGEKVIFRSTRGN